VVVESGREGKLALIAVEEIVDQALSVVEPEEWM